MKNEVLSLYSFYPDLEALARKALCEDVGSGDVTTQALVPPDAEAEAVVFARSDIVVSGNELATAVFMELDPEVSVSIKVADGLRAKPNEPIIIIKGRARSILTGERTALNFMQRLSGIATLASKFVDFARPFGVDILDTRKTTPLLRALEKYAVKCGGGVNHRMGLFDRALIKDNHRKFWARGGERSIAEAVAVTKIACPDVLVEVEVENEDELISALQAAPDWVLLDNVPPSELKRYVQLCKGKCLVEVSGGVNLDSIQEVVRSGVNAVSLGCLTHSAPAADLSLEFL